MTFYSEGEPTTDARARFNLSPVPSMDADEDDVVKDQTQSDYPSLDQYNSDEEFDLNGDVRGTATAVTMLDENHDVNTPLNDKYNNQQGKDL